MIIVPKQLTKYFLLIIFILSNYSYLVIFAQIKKVNGIYYQKDFITKTNRTLTTLNKTAVDTFSYGSFKKIKSNFDLIKGCGNYDADQGAIDIAVNSDGSYMCTWMDLRTGYIEIDAQLFNSSDEAASTVIKVSDAYCKWNSEPNIVYNNISREYIITWASSEYDILLQRISETGEKIGSNFSVTQQAYINTNNPSAAVDQNGSIMITWYAGLESSKVYCREFDKNLVPKTSQVQVSLKPSENVNSFGWDKRIAADSSGNFIITWSSYYNNSSRIVMQQLNNKGEAVSGNIMVSDSTDSLSNTFPTITSIKSGYYFFLWNSGDYLKGRIYKADSGFVTPVFVVSDSSSTWFTYSVSSDDENNFYVGFSSDKHYSQIITKYGEFVGKNKSLPALDQAGFATYPNLSKAINGTIYCVYGLYNKNDQDAMKQRFDTKFNAIGSGVKLGNDLCSSFQTNPVVKYNQSGRSIVVWTDRRDGTDNLYAQVLDENSNPVNGNFLVNDTSFAYWVYNPFIVTDKDGNFIVCFSGGTYLDGNIIIQKISSDGDKIGGNINITNTNNSRFKCAAQIDDNGNIMLCWYIENIAYSPCYLQKFDKDMKPLGDVTTINPNSSGLCKEIMGISINKKFNILVMWADFNTMYDSPYNLLSGMEFNSQGESITDTIYVDTLASYRGYVSGTCYLDNENNAAFEWVDCSNYTYDVNINIRREYFEGSKIYTYTNTINTNDVNSKIQIISFANKKVFAAWSYYDEINSLYADDNNQSYLPVRLQTIDPFIYIWGDTYNAYGADIYNNNIQFCYESIINPDRGYDIWMNTQRIDQFDFNPEPGTSSNASNIEKIESPYPDPVKNSVTFTFSLTKWINVKISIYNILGQKIAELQNGIMGPGTYNKIYNMKGLPSGIYFFYFQGLGSYTKKILLIR